MSEQINSVDFWVDELTRDIDPDHFGFHKRIIPYMDNEKISEFGSWMWNNGYNVGLFDLQTKVNTYCIPQWISVEDRMPAEGDDVLVWFEYYRYGDHNRLYQTYGIGTYFEKSRPWMINHETGWHDLRVIAWMPLPEPPESEGDAE